MRYFFHDKDEHVSGKSISVRIDRLTKQLHFVGSWQGECFVSCFLFETQKIGGEISFEQ